MKRISRPDPIKFQKPTIYNMTLLYTSKKKIGEMGKRFVNYRDILRAEGKVESESKKQIGIFLSKLEELIDLLLEQNYYFDSEKSAKNETPENRLFVFLQDKYFEAPYSLIVCCSLMERGHYLDAMKLLRPLLDYFVSCRFFYSNPQYLMPFLEKKKSRINGTNDWIKTSHIYGHFSETFYKRFWGDLLSSLNHGKIGTNLYRVNRKDPHNPFVILMPEFNQMHALFIMNHFIPIIFGYLIHWESFFRGWLKKTPDEFSEKRREAICWLKEEHFKPKGINKEWLNEINKIVGF